MDFLSHLSAEPMLKPSVQPTEERSISYGGPVVQNWEGAFGFGIEVDKISIVHGCIKLRADTVAQLPIELLKKLPNGTHELAVDHPMYKLVTKRPNAYQTNFTLWHWVMVQLDMFGNALLQKIRNNRGDVIELQPINAQTIEAEINAEGRVDYTIYWMTADNQKMMKKFTDEEVIHLKHFSHNGVLGLSTVENFRLMFEGYAELDRAGVQIAKNAAKPAGVIYYPGVKEEELKKLQAGWANGFSGGNSGKTAWFPNNYKIEGIPAAMSAADAEYVAQKTLTNQRIVTDIFGCPLHRFGLTNAPTYASVELNSLEFINWTISPIIQNIEQQLQKQLLQDDDEYYINFNLNALLRGDIRTRIEWYRFAIQNGIMTANQIVKTEGYGTIIPEDKGGDDFLRALQYGALGSKTVVSNPAMSNPATNPDKKIEFGSDQLSKSN